MARWRDQRAVWWGAARTALVRQAIDAVLTFTVWLSVLVLSDITAISERSNRRSFAMVLFVTAVTTAMLAQAQIHSSRPSLPRTDEVARSLLAVFGGAAGLAVLAAFVDWNLGATELLVGSAALAVARAMTWGILRDVFDREQQTSAKYRRHRHWSWARGWSDLPTHS